MLARLRVGDVTGAQAAFARLADAGGRTRDDVRSRMLEAQVEAAVSGAVPDTAARSDSMP